MTGSRSKCENWDQELKEITIQNFIHRSCAPTTDAKRLRAIRRILSSQFDYSHHEFQQIWKGLFYCIWYSEMGKSCEELIYEVSYNCQLKNKRDYLLAGFELLAQEWMGIDFIRIDKYAHLVRHLINSTLQFILYQCEPRDFDLLDDIFTGIEPTVELFTHVVEIFMEELANVMVRQVIWKKDEKAEVYVNSVAPFIKVMSRNKDPRVLETINEYIAEVKDIVKQEDSEIRSQFRSSMVKEIVKIGQDDQVRLKNRKMIFHIANQIKPSAKLQC